MGYIGNGHYGILRLGEKVVGGFLYWGIGAAILEKGKPLEFTASAKEWWLNESIADNTCEAAFYHIVDNKEIEKDRRAVVFTCGSREKGKLIKSLFTMKQRKEKV